MIMMMMMVMMVMICITMILTRSFSARSKKKMTAATTATASAPTDSPFAASPPKDTYLIVSRHNLVPEMSLMEQNSRCWGYHLASRPWCLKQPESSRNKGYLLEMSTSHRRSKFQQVPIKEKLQFRWIRQWFHTGFGQDRAPLCDCANVLFLLSACNRAIQGLHCLTCFVQPFSLMTSIAYHVLSLKSQVLQLRSQSLLPCFPLYRNHQGVRLCFLHLWQIRISTVRISVGQPGASLRWIKAWFGVPVWRLAGGSWVLFGSPILTILRPPHIGLFHRTVFTLVSSYFILFHLISDLGMIVDHLPRFKSFCCLIPFKWSIFSNQGFSWGSAEISQVLLLVLRLISANPLAFTLPRARA